MVAAEVRELIDDKVWWSYFKFAFDRNPWDRQVSLYHLRHRNEKAPPTFASFLHEDARARIDNYDIYSIDGDVAVDFLGRYENLADDLKLALGHVGIASKRSCRAPRPRSAATPCPIAIIMTMTLGESWRAGMRARSGCSTMSSEPQVSAA